jgi:predicted RNA-binding Zn ribbon-like protein
MTAAYQGPLRHEPLAIELHNTLYADRGERFDGLETAGGLMAWLAAISDRLPEGTRDVDGSRRSEFLRLRDAVREGLHAVLEGERVPRETLEAVNAAAARAPASPLAVPRGRGRLQAETRYHTDDATDIALAAFASSAIELLTAPKQAELRACGAPGCVLMFLHDHPRRRWCSTACGNRARQARHYERTRRARPPQGGAISG